MNRMGIPSMKLELKKQQIPYTVVTQRYITELLPTKHNTYHSTELLCPCCNWLKWQSIFVLVFIVRSLDLYKAKSPLDIELVNG